MKKVLTLCCAVILAACAKMAPPEPSTASADASGSGGQLFTELDRAAGSEENVFYSPVSVEQAFGLLHAGTAGETRDQLAAFFGWPAGEAADRQLRLQRESLLAHRTDADIRLANALWLSNEFRFRPAYLDATRRHYDATAEVLAFRTSPAAAARRINGWAADRTNGLIDRIVSADALADDTAALLTNALYFEAEWQFKFDSAVQRPFLFGDGREQAFHLMLQTDPFAVAERAAWRAIRMPYRGGRFAMDVILPERRQAMAAAPAPEVLADFDEALTAAEPRLVALELPRFEVDYDIGLVEPLEALGLNLPFDRNRADLSAMAEPGQNPLYVKDATHITKLQVYEDGTKAAAVTTLRIVPTASRLPREDPIPFVVDRPFVVIIRDLQSRQILFLGRISTPQPFTPEAPESE
jgi:serine protease inhibitor